MDERTVVDDEVQETLYTYDALGRQATRGDGSAIRLTHYGDLTDIPILDTDAEGQPTMSYVQGPKGLVEQRSAEATIYPLPDAHGDVTAILDGAAEPVSRQTYDPWGSQLSGPSLEMGWLGAQQRRADPATELIQMGVRPYSQELGSFLSEDPVLGHLGRGVTMNRYPYAWNDPMNRYDLDGRDVCLPSPWGKACAEDTVDGAWDRTAGARDFIGVAGDGNGGWLSESPDYVSDRGQDFLKGAKKVLPNMSISWKGPCRPVILGTIRTSEACEGPEGELEYKNSEPQVFFPGINPPGGVPGFTVPVPGPVRTPAPAFPLIP